MGILRLCWQKNVDHYVPSSYSIRAALVVSINTGVKNGNFEVILAKKVEQYISARYSVRAALEVSNNVQS